MSYLEMSPEKIEKKVRKEAAHPKVSVMVDTAIKTLAEPKGSSMRAITNYISANYSVDIKKLSIFIKKYLKASVERGDLIQPKGKGAAGSFKINKQKAEAKPKEPKVKPPKPLKMNTSTPNKVPKSKKATKSPNKSPVKKMKLTDLEAVSADATFSKPNIKKAKKAKVSLPTKPRKSVASLSTKVKPKKLMAKKTEPKVPVSPGLKPKNKSPKLVKTKQQAGKAAKTKKSPKPASILKKAGSKKASVKVEQK